MLKIYPVPALDSNYFWLLQPDAAKPAAYIIDPGAAEPVISELDRHQLVLAGILVTHHHGDHVGGIAALVERYRVPVYGPRSARIPQVDHYVKEGATLSLDNMILKCWKFPVTPRITWPISITPHPISTPQRRCYSVAIHYSALVAGACWMAPPPSFIHPYSAWPNCPRTP